MKKISIFCLSLFMVWAACKKDSSTVTNPTPSSPSNPSNPNPTTFGSLKEAFASITPKSKTVSFDAAKGASFHSDNGVRYVFAPNAFLTMANKPVNGTVNIEVRDCIKESDMILNRMLSLSNGNVLISAGSAFIRASQAGADIKLRSSLAFEIRFPTNKGAATADMIFFKGQASEPITGTDVNWVPVFDSLRKIVYNGDTISVFPDSTGLINIDKFEPSALAKVNVKIEGVGGSLDTKNLSAYYILDGVMSAVALTTYSGGTYSSNEFKAIKMAKRKAHIVVCTVYMGELYGGTLNNVTAADGAAYTVTVSKMTPAAFKIMVDALP